MALLHYGPKLCIELEAAAIRQVMEAVAAHASRGGWVTLTDTQGQDRSLLVSAGIALWIDHDH